MLVPGIFWTKANSCIIMSLNILWNGAHDIIYKRVGPIVEVSVKLRPFKLCSAHYLASHAGIFRGARFSSLPTNACSTENNIPFPLFYLRGK